MSYVCSQCIKIIFTSAGILFFFFTAKTSETKLMTVAFGKGNKVLFKTDQQVVANGRKLNLRRNLPWVAKRTGKFPRKYTQVANKADYPLFHWLIMG